MYQDHPPERRLPGFLAEDKLRQLLDRREDLPDDRQPHQQQFERPKEHAPEKVDGEDADRKNHRQGDQKTQPRNLKPERPAQQPICE